MSMPRKPFLQRVGAPLVFAFLAAFFIVLQFLMAEPTHGNLGLLAPAETSSPQATMNSFRSDAGRAATLLMEAHRQNMAEPGLTWSVGVTEKVRQAEGLLARASRALDLRDIPPVDLEHRRLEATLLLKEVLDRVRLPDAATIPGQPPSPPASWNVPGTDIRIVRLADGPRAGEYLFSSETVHRLDDFYRMIRAEPNLHGGEDFYEFFSQSPGRLIPPKWYSAIEALPPFWRIEIDGQAIWQWVGFALVLGLGVLSTFGVYRLERSIRTNSDASPSLAAKLLLPATLAAAALSVAYIADYQINLTGRINDLVEEIAQATAYLASIWGVIRFTNDMAGRLTFSKSESIDAHLARAAVRIVGIGFALALLIYGASYLGIPLAGLLAGLGVGGLAVALAAKPTLENFIGGLILYVDRPVRVGDLCRLGNLEGRVEEIGIRSTRIRGLDRALITIPNATFANMNIINLTNRDRMPYNRTVSLQSADSIAIRQEIEALAALVAEHPLIEPGSVQVRLREGHEEKPKVEIGALMMTSVWSHFLQIQQEIDLMLRDRVLTEQGVSPAIEPNNVYSLKEPETGEKARTSTLP